MRFQIHQYIVIVYSNEKLLKYTITLTVLIITIYFCYGPIVKGLILLNNYIIYIKGFTFNLLGYNILNNQQNIIPNVKLKSDFELITKNINVKDINVNVNAEDSEKIINSVINPLLEGGNSLTIDFSKINMAEPEIFTSNLSNSTTEPLDVNLEDIISSIGDIIK